MGRTKKKRGLSLQPESKTFICVQSKLLLSQILQEHLNCIQFPKDNDFEHFIYLIADSKPF